MMSLQKFCQVLKSKFGSLLGLCLKMMGKRVSSLKHFLEKGVVMQKKCLFAFVASLFVFWGSYLAAINFGSRNSALKFSPGTTFNVSSADLALDIGGTLVKGVGAQISGNKIQFSKRIESDDTWFRIKPGSF